MQWRAGAEQRSNGAMEHRATEWNSLADAMRTSNATVGASFYARRSKVWGQHSRHGSQSRAQRLSNSYRNSIRVRQNLRCRLALIMGISKGMVYLRCRQFGAQCRAAKKLSTTLAISGFGLLVAHPEPPLKPPRCKLGGALGGFCDLSEQQQQ